MGDHAWLTIFAAILGSGAFSTIINWALSKIDRNNPIRQGMRTLLYLHLKDIHDRMDRNHGCLSLDDKQTAEQIHQSYHTVGGNSLGDVIIDEIRHAKSPQTNRKDPS